MNNTKGNQINVGGSAYIGGDITISSGHRHIVAKNYIQGNVYGGNIAGRDITINNTENLNKEQWLALLNQFKQELTASDLSSETIEEVSNNLAVIENQAKKAKPNGELINGLLDDSNQALSSIEQGGEKVLNLMATISRLAGFISGIF